MLFYIEIEENLSFSHGFLSIKTLLLLFKIKILLIIEFNITFYSNLIIKNHNLKITLKYDINLK